MFQNVYFLLPCIYFVNAKKLRGILFMLITLFVFFVVYLMAHTGLNQQDSFKNQIN